MSNTVIILAFKLLLRCCSEVLSSSPNASGKKNVKYLTVLFACRTAQPNKVNTVRLVQLQCHMYNGGVTAIQGRPTAFGGGRGGGVKGYCVLRVQAMRRAEDKKTQTRS